MDRVEEWKDIEGYEGLYQVSNLGRVKSLNYLHTGKEQILKNRLQNNNYLFVYLCKNSIKKNCSVHRLVAKAFLENPNNYPCVNHIDEDKTNNNINNLEWCTHKHNINHGTHNQRSVENRSIFIYCLETDKIYNSLKQSSEELNIHHQHISMVLKSRSKQAKGYTFRYAKYVLFKGESINND